MASLFKAIYQVTCTYSPLTVITTLATLVRPLLYLARSISLTANLLQPS